MPDLNTPDVPHVKVELLELTCWDGVGRTEGEYIHSL